MTDQVPDVLEFETLKIYDEPNKTENILKLEDPPLAECNQTTNVEINIFTDKPKYSEEKNSEHEELLNLHEPPNEEENKVDNFTNNFTNEAVCQFVQNLVDPIVKEAIERAEMEDSISDEVKVDSSGDKKSERSSTDDEFEHLKADDINSSTSIDQNNEEINKVLDPECLSKSIENDSFIQEDLKFEESTFTTINETHNNPGVTNDLIVEDEAVECPFPPGKIELKSSDEVVNDEAYDFDLQDVKEYEANLSESEHLVEVSESMILKSASTDLKSKSLESNSESLDETVETIEKITELGLKTDVLETLKEPKNDLCESFETTKNDICQKCKNVFCWKDPILSSIVLSIIMFIELGLMCDYSIISLLAYSGLLLLFSSFVYKFAIKFNLLRKCDESNCSISFGSDDIQLCVDYVLKWIEYLFNEIKSLTYLVSFTKNLKAFIFFWILTYVGQWFNLLSLIFIGTVILFSLPIIYTTYKETIDQVMNKICDQIKDSINNLKLKFQHFFGRRAR